MRSARPTRTTNLILLLVTSILLAVGLLGGGAADAVTSHSVQTSGDWASCENYLVCLYYDGNGSAIYAVPQGSGAVGSVHGDGATVSLPGGF